MTEEHCEYEHSHPDRIVRKHGAIIECQDCPVEWEVLMNDHTGEFELVRTEVTQPETWWQHPLAKGLGALALALTAFMGPIFGGAQAARHYMDVYATVEGTELWALMYFFGIAAFGVSWVLVGLLERHTPVNKWIFTFDRWSEVRRKL